MSSQPSKTDVRCPVCKALLFKNWNCQGDVEIKCRKCKEIVKIKINA